MLIRRLFLASYRLFFALLGIAAVIKEISKLVDSNNFSASSFFSYFTIQSNIFVSVVLIVGALALLRNKTSKFADKFRGPATLYMLTTSIVFTFFVAGLDFSKFSTLGWDNKSLHFFIPIAVLIDWIVVKPKNTIKLKQAFAWVLYPFFYIVYTLVRGEITGWYPYDLLNPNIKDYAHVAQTSVLVLSIVTVLSLVILALNILRKH